ncbi:MAG: IS66 family insertion sequence element accessory protein TnpB [Deltaproteobacteria bacterium]|nr:IS66 family insertion sequence element accessory protein TnpB [Deltaproteobacteria bacterium]
MRPLETVRVHLCREAVDFRKAINGLSALVAEDLALDPFSAHVFGFCNRRRDQVKLLVWERNGFVLWQKRLEKDRFPWPRGGEDAVLAVTGRELNWLLDGIDVFRLRPHAELSFSSVR